MHAAEYGHYRILQVIALFIEDNKLYNNTDNSVRIIFMSIYIFY